MSTLKRSGTIHERLQIKVGWEEVAHPNGRVLVFDVPSRAQGQPIHYEGPKPYFKRRSKVAFVF